MMYLTLILFIIFVPSYLVAWLITRWIKHKQELKRRRILCNTPSPALIDQLLPLEILYNIVTSQGLEFMKLSRQVSKYWNYATSSISPSTYLNMLAVRPSNTELDLDQLAFSTEPPINVRWLEYPESYNLRWIYDDVNLAREQGKKMIDADLIDVLNIADRLRGDLSSRLNQSKTNKYLAKVRVFVRKIEYGVYHMVESREPDLTITIRFDRNNNEADPESGMVEVVTSLEHFKRPYCSIPYDATKRIIPSTIPKDIIPKYGALKLMLIYLFAPSLVSDLLHFVQRTSFHHIFQQILGFAVIFGMLCQLQKYHFFHYKKRWRKNTIKIAFWTGCTTFNIIFASLMVVQGIFLEFTSFVAFIVMISSYDYALKKETQALEWQYRYGEIIRGICIGIIFLTVDWMAVFKSIIDGSILIYAIYNVIYSTVTSTIFTLAQLIQHRNFQAINTPYYWGWMLKIYIISSFYTLYVPDSINSINY